MDEEICRYILAARKKIEVTPQTLELETILSLGAHGNYLTHPSTFQHFRSLFQNNLGSKDPYSTWAKKGARDIVEQASELLEKRIAAYTKPDMDQGLEQELLSWATYRKTKINDLKKSA